MASSRDGLYYAPGSQKARLCREGKAELETFLEGHAIPFERCGKLGVALRPGELPRLSELLRRATANGVPGLEEIEPHAVRNAPSPAATASLAIGRKLAEQAIERFELARARP